MTSAENTAQEVCTPLTPARADWDIIRLAEFLIERRVKAAPVVDAGGALVGVVGLNDIERFTHEVEERPGSHTHPWYTDRVVFDEDELHAGIDVLESEETTVADIAQPVLHTLPGTTPLAIVCRVMVLKQLHRIVITDEGGKAVGTLAALDLLGTLVGASAP